MQIRKLVKSGHASLVIAVPKPWITRNKLKQGDLLYIEEQGNKLSIDTEFKNNIIEKNEIVINVENKVPEIIKREIIAAYLDNYYQIIVKGKDLKKNLKFVKKVISDLVAFELIEESSERIVANSFLNITDIDLNVLIRRIDNIIRSTFIDIKSVHNDPDLAKTIIDRDNEVNRLNFLVTRILKSAYHDNSLLGILEISEIRILQFWEINGQLEKIGDRLKYIVELLLKLTLTEVKQFQDIFYRLETFYIKGLKSFYSHSSKLSDEISTQRFKIIEDITKFASKSKSIEVSQISINLYNVITRINDIGRIVRYIN